MSTSTHHLTTTLLDWFRHYGRDLPWRNTRDPYAIWLSEIILQQTRVQQGMAYWERFMRHWPTVEMLADATEDEVLREWQGLGYYSRARNLHKAAQQIVTLGAFPRTIEDIKKLAGVGDYTAAAIGSIAFGLPAAVVDGNVYRVLSRYFGISTPINSTVGKKEFTALAQSLLPDDEAAAFNQAIMDFGAIQCTPQSPRCLDCPLQESCAAHHEGQVALLPVKLKKTQVKTRRFTYIYFRCHGHTAIHRRGEGDIWQGLWEPYLTEEEPMRDFGGQLTLLRKDVRHVLTHRVLLADFYLCETETSPTLPPDYIWIGEDDIERYALPRLIEILLESVSPADSSHLQGRS